MEIDIEAYPPLASCPGNDDFDGTALDRNRWSVVREDANFLSVDGGTLNLNAQPGEDIHGGATGQRNIVLQDLPDSGPWTATARVTWNPTVNYQNAGLVIYTDDANWIKSGMVWSNGRAFEAFKELNNNATGLGSPDRRRLVPEHVLRALHQQRHDRAGAALARRPDVDEHRQRDQPERADQPEDRDVRHGVHQRRDAGRDGALRLLHARRAAGSRATSSTGPR